MNPPIIKFLIESGAKADPEDLILVCKNGHLQIAMLLIASGVNFNSQDKKGMTALMHASQKGHLDIVKLLINVGANVNTQDKSGFTALMLAVFSIWIRGFENKRDIGIEIIKLLMMGGADVNLQAKNGKTALTITSNKEIIRALQAESQCLKACG